MSVETTRRVLEAYLEGHDTVHLAEDAVFTDTASGQRHEGREAISAMLEYVYHVGLQATAEVLGLIVADGQAAVEAEIVGTHTGDFAGMPATGAQVRIPLCVTYRVSDGQIQEGTVYLGLTNFLSQIGARSFPRA